MPRTCIPLYTVGAAPILVVATECVDKRLKGRVTFNKFLTLPNSGEPVLFQVKVVYLNYNYS